VIVVDSCGWLEYFTNSELSVHYSAAIEDTEHLLVPSITITEVFKKVLRETDESSALLCAAAMCRGRVVDLDVETGLLAARYGVEYRLPLADSIVYATAIQYGAEILTEDADFEGLPSVTFFRKS
jgi:predicted nucleic acid-binding protein